VIWVFDVTAVIMANPASNHKSELRLVGRALTAAALSLVIGQVLALSQSYWAVITALIVGGRPIRGEALSDKLRRDAAETGGLT
jgi:uncharacterized membrane protein YccC